MFRWVCLAVGVVALGFLGWYLYDLRASRSAEPVSAVEACACPAEKSPSAHAAAPAQTPPVVVTGACECDPVRRSCECASERPICQCANLRRAAVRCGECAQASTSIVVVECDRLLTPPPAPAFVPRCPPPVVRDSCGCARAVCPTLNGHRAQLTFTGTDSDPSLRWLGCKEGWFLVDGLGGTTAIYP